MFDPKNMISNNIFVYKNFVSQDILDNINKEIESFTDDSWTITNAENHQRSIDMKSLLPVIEKIKLIVPKDMFINKNLSINKLSKGHSWGEHSDNADFLKNRELAKLIKSGEPYDYAENIVFGLVFYINNFDGGELFYVNKNIKFKPEAGDLVIHGAEDDCRHKVLEVLSDFRYSYSNSIREVVKVPVQEKK